MWNPRGLYVLVRSGLFVKAISSKNKIGVCERFACESFARTCSRYSWKFLTVEAGRSFLTLTSFCRTPCCRYNLRSPEAEMRLSGNFLWKSSTLSFIVRPAQRIKVSRFTRKSLWNCERFLSSFCERFFDFCEFFSPVDKFGKLCCRASLGALRPSKSLSTGQNRLLESKLGISLAGQFLSYYRRKSHAKSSFSDFWKIVGYIYLNFSSQLNQIY